MNNPCPLCHADKAELYVHTKHRDYFHCTVCELIYHKQLLSKTEEKTRYDQHQNHIIDEGYATFLYQVINPIKERIKFTELGLDYGSGPFPALVKLLKEEGYKMRYYDPYFANDKTVLNKKYDFITLTEVAEHFYHPDLEFDRLYSLLKKGGYLFVMTYRTDLITDFHNWHYIKDDTHVCLYANATMHYIANKYQMKLELLNDRVVVLKK